MEQLRQVKIADYQKYDCGSIHSANLTTHGGGITPINGKIKWHLDESIISGDLEKYKIIAAIQKAFNYWQPHFNPLFEATGNLDQAAIVFRFRLNGDKDLPIPFTENTLAYAYYPSKESLGIHSDVYINDLFDWGEAHSDIKHNLIKVLVHELGHSFGFGHSENPTDILFNTYSPNDEVVLTTDTLEAVELLYGKKEKPEEENKYKLALMQLSLEDILKIRETKIVSMTRILGGEADAAFLKEQNAIRFISQIMKK